MDYGLSSIVNGEMNPPMSYMLQAQQCLELATLDYQMKDRSLQESLLNQQILLNEIQQRDYLIADLKKMTGDELQKKDNLIFRLKRELSLMMNLCQGYRESIEQTDKGFKEYRQLYATMVELEKVFDEAIKGYIGEFEGYLKKVAMLDSRLMACEKEVNWLNESAAAAGHGEASETTSGGGADACMILN